MTMNYQKMTIPVFQERLKQGQYQGITGARRAIGKADWGQAERDKAKQIANRHFKVSDAVRTEGKSSSRPDGRTKASGSRNSSVVPRGASADGVSYTARNGKTGTTSPSTNSEIVELCGTANEITETIRRSAEVSVEVRPTLVKANELLFNCLEMVTGALKGDASSAGKAVTLGRSVQNLGQQVRPQPHIHRREEESDLSDDDKRSMAASR